MSIQDRIRENHKKRKDYSIQGKEYVLNLPESTKLFKAYYDKKNKIIILPYKVKTDNDPKAKKGEENYVLEYYVHRDIGINKDQFVCLNRTYGKPCPICEEIDRLKKEDDEDSEDLIKKYNASKKASYNVLDCLSENPAEVKIFNASFAYFEKELLDEVIDPETDDLICFADVSENGYYVKFKATEETYQRSKYPKYKNFTFEKRGKAIPKRILEKVLSLDELLIIPTYEQVKAAFMGADDEEEYFKEVSSKETKDQVMNKRKSKVKEEDQEDDEEENNKLFDEDENDFLEENEEEQEEIEEEEEETKKTSKKETKKSKKEPGKEKNKCLYGFNFGVDTDTENKCIECKIWDECSEAKDLKDE